MSETLTISIPTDMKFIEALAPEWIPFIEEQTKLADKLKKWSPLETQTVNVIVHGFVLDDNGDLDTVGTPCDECYFDAIKDIDGNDGSFCYNCRDIRAHWDHIYEPKTHEMTFAEWQKQTARKEYQGMSFDEVVESFRQRKLELNKNRMQREAMLCGK
jgi:hypothetical protein